jgi:hypothetical protein
MMRVLVGLTICLAGCAFEHGQSATGGAGDDDDGTTPRVDSDNDGVEDAFDNCATKPNADQRDHDTDARGDVCDVCPHLPETGSDADADGVGDGCDPHPLDNHDRIALFEGFYDPVSWSTVIGGASWQVQGGLLRQSQTGGPAQLVRGASALGEVFVDARLRANALSPNAQMRRSTGIVLGFADPNHYFFCGLSAQGPYVEVQSGAVSTDWLGNAQYNYAPGQFASGMTSDWLTLQATTRQRDDSTQIDCMGHSASTTGTATFYSDDDASGDIGLRTNGVDASFDYVFVVATTP